MTYDLRQLCTLILNLCCISAL